MSLQAIAQPVTVSAVPCGRNADGTPINRRRSFQATELEPFREGTTRIWERMPYDHRLRGDRFAPAAIVWTDSIRSEAEAGARNEKAASCSNS